MTTREYQPLELDIRFHIAIGKSTEDNNGELIDIPTYTKDMRLVTPWLDQVPWYTTHAGPSGATVRIYCENGHVYVGMAPTAQEAAMCAIINVMESK